MNSNMNRRGNYDIQLSRKQENIYNNLKVQIDKAFSTNKRQMREGNNRYINSCYAFAKHLAKHYGSQTFRNIEGKHIQSFIDERDKHGIQLDTILSDVSSIRKLHHLTGGRRFIPPNEKLLFPEPQSDTEEKIDRAWTEEEYNKALQIARNLGRYDVINSFKLARHFGVRLNEATAMTKTRLREALKDGYLHVTHTKNNVERDIQIENPYQKQALREIIDNTRNESLFIDHKTTHEQAKKSIQNWIYNHRNKFQDQNVKINEDRYKKKCTFHGIRHTYARENYNNNIKNGGTEREARLDTSHKLGHGRDAVTKIYL